MGPYQKFGYINRINEFVVDASEAPGVGGIFASIRVIVLDER